MQEARVWLLGWEDPLEKEMKPHYHILDWRIPWIEEPGRLQSMRLQKSGTTSWLNHPHHLTVYLLFVPSFPFLYPLLFCLHLGWVCFIIPFYLIFFLFCSSMFFCGSYMNYNMHSLFKTVVCLEGYFMNNLRSFKFLSSPSCSCHTFHSLLLTIPLSI